MDIFAQIIAEYSELTDKDFMPATGTILLQDDGDGIQYIAKWDYDKPLPEGMKVGKN